MWFEGADFFCPLFLGVALHPTNKPLEFFIFFSPLPMGFFVLLYLVCLHVNQSMLVVMAISETLKVTLRVSYTYKCL